jgi:hypothetical protein
VAVVVGAAEAAAVAGDDVAVPLVAAAVVARLSGAEGVGVRATVDGAAPRRAMSAARRAAAADARARIWVG